MLAGTQSGALARTSAAAIPSGFETSKRVGSGLSEFSWMRSDRSAQPFCSGSERSRSSARLSELGGSFRRRPLSAAGGVSKC